MPTRQVTKIVGSVEKVEEVDSGQGGLPGATTELADQLESLLEHGCTVHGVDIPPSPRLFEDARQDIESLDMQDAMATAKELCTPGNAPKLGSLKPVPEQYKTTVVDLSKEAHRLVKLGKYKDAAIMYREAYALHPTSQTLGKLALDAENADIWLSGLEAQLRAGGGAISWCDFVACWTTTKGCHKPAPPAVAPEQPGKTQG